MLEYFFATTTFILLIYMAFQHNNVRRKIKKPISGDNIILQILVRKSLKMKPGKIAAQVGHGVIGAYRKSHKETILNWINNGEPIIVLKAEDEEINTVIEKAKNANILVHKVYDAGRTQVVAGSNTILTLGPAPKEILNMITGSLKLMS